MPSDRLARLPVRSPEWWREKLGGDLAKRLPTVRRYERYYEGVHTLKFMTDRFKEAFGQIFDHLADNWMELVVDAVAERLTVQGFRFGDDPKADNAAWSIWQANNLDAESKIGFVDALVQGVTYLLVEPIKGEPRITVEHPAQAIVAHEPGDRHRRAAGLKAWVDDDGHSLAWLWLPNGIHRWRSKKTVDKHTEWGDIRWDPLGGRLANPLGVVPLIPLVNRPRIMRPWGKSEIDNVTGTQDAVNKLIVDMMVAAHFASFRQKWATGLEIPVDEDTGKPVEAFKEAVDRIWHTAAPDAKFGTFEAADLSQYVSSIEMLVQHIASQTRTPPHYFFLRGEFPSGESIKSAETGLVAKARDRMVHFGEALEQAMRLAFQIRKDARSDEVKAETIWADPESRTESEMVDAAVKRKAIGVPSQQLQEDVGYTPTQIARFETMRMRDALAAGTTAAILNEPTDEPAAAATS